MINATDKEFVLKYVDDKYYDTERLIKYLTMHDTVGNEVFQYCDRRVPDKSKATYSQWLDDEDGYCPLPVADFIRRVPFYFYTRDYDNMETENRRPVRTPVLVTWRGFEPRTHCLKGSCSAY